MSENKDQNQDSSTVDSGVADEALEAIKSSPLSETSAQTGPAVNSDEDTSIEEIDKILTEADPKFGETIKNIQANAEELDQADLSLSLPQKVDWKKILKQLKSVKFWMITLGVLVFVSAGLYVIWKNPIHLVSNQLFLTSYADLGAEVHEFKADDEMEAFYDNPRFAKNLISISRMIVNVRPSKNSGSNPMLAIEINAEGISPEATIELKDREAEFKDLLIRQAEDFTYDELITTEGKQNLCDQFRLVINANLTNGQIRKVFLKAFVIKP